LIFKKGIGIQYTANISTISALLTNSKTALKRDNRGENIESLYFPGTIPSVRVEVLRFYRGLFKKEELCTRSKDNKILLEVHPVCSGIIIQLDIQAGPKILFLW
jgi:hypothetical protein